MSKKRSKKEASKPAASQTATAVASSFFQKIRLNSWLFFIAAFLLYAPTIKHEFILDDGMLIYKNHATSQGIAGISKIFSEDVSLGNMEQNQRSDDVVAGGRYRPLSIAVFAVIYEFFGANPVPYHLITVLFYALCCVVLYRSLLIIFKDHENVDLMAWIASCIFVLHPLHTEVVNNNKASDEILALAFSMGGLVYTLLGSRTGKSKFLIYAFLSFLAACFAKENSIMFLALVPITLYLDGGNNRRNWASIFKLSVPVLIASVIFLLVRGSVLGWSLGEPKLNLINNAFVKFVDNRWEYFSWTEKYPTIFYTLGKYLWLHIFPHPLSHDYYPRAIAIQSFTSPWVLASIAAYAFMIWYSVRGLIRGKLEPISYGIGFYLITLFIVSNIPVSLGTTMAERFAFMPSAGICMSIGGLLVALLAAKPTWTKAVAVLFALVCVAYVAKTIVRTGEYSSNFILFKTDVETVENSARVHYGYGGTIMKKALQQQPKSLEQRELLLNAISEFTKAINIHPTYSESFYARGSSYYLLGNYQDAINDFTTSLSITPGRPEVINNFALALLEAGRDMINQQNYKQAILYLSKGNEVVPNNPDMLIALGMAQIRDGSTEAGKATIQKVLAIDPNNQQALSILGKTGY